MSVSFRLLFALSVTVVLAVQLPPQVVELAVFQTVLDHQPLEVYFKQGSATQEGLCILRNGKVPPQYRLYKFGRAVPQLTEEMLMEYQRHNYLIFTQTYQAGDSAFVSFQSRAGRVEVELGMRKVARNWEVRSLELIQLP